MSAGALLVDDRSAPADNAATRVPARFAFTPEARFGAVSPAIPAIAAVNRKLLPKFMTAREVGNVPVTTAAFQWLLQKIERWSPV